MRSALLVAALLNAAIAGAQDPAPVPLESFAAPLLKARTYCESGKWGVSNGPKVPMSETTYRVCGRSDGRFKYVQNPGQPGQFVLWSDGQNLHRYVLYEGVYQTYDLTTPDAEYTYPKPREQVPALHSRLFRSATRSAAGLDLLGTLRDYRINDGLSDGQRKVYEFVGDDKRSLTRIQVTAAGGITRLESWYGGNLSAFMEITSREVDQPLSDVDLDQQVPLLTRYSYRNAPAVFIVGLFVVTIIAGIAFWTWLFARNTEAPDGTMRVRNRLWRYFAGAFILVASMLVLLAVTTRGGSGHPPAIVYVMVMAVLAGIAFALMACFLLSSYAGQALARRRRT